MLGGNNSRSSFLENSWPFALGDVVVLLIEVFFKKTNIKINSYHHSEE